MKCGKCKSDGVDVSHVRGCYGQAAGAVQTQERLPDSASWDRAGSAGALGGPSWRGLPATDKQVAYMESLLKTRGYGMAPGRALPGTRGPVSDLIGLLKAPGNLVPRTVRDFGLRRLCATIPVPEVAAPVASVRTPYPDVPAGHYAVASRTGHNDLDFYRVDRPETGVWAGRTYVRRVIGGRPSVRVRGAEAREALERILSAGVESARVRYGQEIGRCWHCNRHLTDGTSRKLGIGPVCREGG